ncbi:MAG: uracil-DNA glycosylase [Candidatus Kapabacteria bacterium]|nr:uracil-DNA glycosylase [Candidatus Kapabacteria bacterium]
MYGDVLYADRIDAAPVALEAPIRDEARVQAAHVATTVEAADALPEQEMIVSEGWHASTTIDELKEAICSCMECPLGHSRTNFVFGSGNPNADIMVVGEAPGADEDAQGLPFVGRDGQLLTKVLEAIQLSRDEVFICNILKCRPPNNRKPLVSETDQCEPYLWKQIELVKPRFILALGLTAANTLLRNKESMSALRGKTHDYHGIPLLVTYHPAALLRNPEWKVHTWEDVKLLRRLYDESKASA